MSQPFATNTDAKLTGSCCSDWIARAVEIAAEVVENGAFRSRPSTSTPLRKRAYARRVLVSFLGSFPDFSMEL